LRQDIVFEFAVLKRFPSEIQLLCYSLQFSLVKTLLGIKDGIMKFPETAFLVGDFAQLGGGQGNFIPDAEKVAVHPTDLVGVIAHEALDHADTFRAQFAGKAGKMHHGHRCCRIAAPRLPLYVYLDPGRLRRSEQKFQVGLAAKTLDEILSALLSFHPFAGRRRRRPLSTLTKRSAQI
jgi:hypothetical protein